MQSSPRVSLYARVQISRPAPQKRRGGVDPGLITVVAAIRKKQSAMQRVAYVFPRLGAGASGDEQLDYVVVTQRRRKHDRRPPAPLLRTLIRPINTVIQID